MWESCQGLFALTRIGTDRVDFVRFFGHRKDIRMEIRVGGRLIIEGGVAKHRPRY